MSLVPTGPSEKVLDAETLVSANSAPPSSHISEVEKEDIVNWDGPKDPLNPVNWSGGKRWAHIILVATSGLIPNMATTMIASDVDSVAEEFSIHNTTVISLCVTIYLLGSALGPMTFASFGEAYGRLPVYHASNIALIAFTIGNALSQTTAQFIVFRFLSGCAGGMPLAMGGGTIADLTSPAQRGLPTTLFTAGSLAGPVFGPVIGGFVAAAKGWRWLFWLIAILEGANEIMTLIVMRETSPKIILERKTARLRTSTGNMNLRSKLAHKLTPRQVITQALIRPSMMLIRSPIVALLSLYTALVFGVMLLLFTTFPAIFRGQYGFSLSISGLPYLGLAIALGLGIIVWHTLDPLILSSRMKADGVDQPKPEYRLALMILLSPSVAFGLFIFGWTTQFDTHWIVPIVGTFFIGFGSYFVLMPSQLYLIMLFGSKGAASALGAYNLVRYLGGTFLPLAGPNLFGSLGYGWGSTLLGFLSLFLVIPPIFFYRYGERMREKNAVVF